MEDNAVKGGTHVGGRDRYAFAISEGSDAVAGEHGEEKVESILLVFIADGRRPAKVAAGVGSERRGGKIRVACHRRRARRGNRARIGRSEGRI